MKKTFTCLMCLLPLMVISCAQNSVSSVQSYDGRTYDISKSQDQSLIVTSIKVDNYYQLEITGNGEAIDYNSKTAVPWNPIVKKVNKVTINDGITYIGDFFFNSLNLEHYFLPSSVEAVGDNTFNEGATIYTYGERLDNYENCFVYSENKPSGEGKYFYLEDGEPQIWSTISFFFIGNSFTFRQGSQEHPQVPEYFQKIAINLNKDVEIDFVVESSYTLTRYADKTDDLGKIVESKLTTNQYDYVILQEQSTTPINNYNNFLEAVRKLKTRIDETQKNCKVILYETWGSPAGIKNTSFAAVGEMEQSLRTAYENAAKACNCGLNYIGKAFTYAYENHSDIKIYADDDRHQSSLGAYLSAACHIRSIFKLDVTKCTEYCELDKQSCITLLNVANTVC